MAAGTVSKGDFGKLPDGKAVEIYTLKSADLELQVMTYGARIVFTDDEGPRRQDGRRGAGVQLGRRIRDRGAQEDVLRRDRRALRQPHCDGKFSLDGKTYQIPINNGNALHGGPEGFDDQLWTAKQIPDGVEMTLVSKDGDMGFPGTLTVHVRYTLVGNAVQINYSATTDKPTVINITNHAYFNLAGDGPGTILDEVLMIDADGYTPVDAGLIPVGGVQPVAGTPFDFRKSTVIGKRINDNEQLKIAGGYDHNWVLRGANGEIKTAARVYDPATGRVLTVTTTEPGVQFYTGNFLDGTSKGNAWRLAVCEECRSLPGDAALPRLAESSIVPEYRA